MYSNHQQCAPVFPLCEICFWSNCDGHCYCWGNETGRNDTFGTDYANIIHLLFTMAIQRCTESSSSMRVHTWFMPNAYVKLGYVRKIKRRQLPHTFILFSSCSSFFFFVSFLLINIYSLLLFHRASKEYISFFFLFSPDFVLKGTEGRGMGGQLFE